MEQNITPIIEWELEGYGTVENIFNDFNVSVEERKGVQILFGSYETGNLDGSADVIFMKDGKLYQVYGSHCSCYRLENQWDACEVTIEQLRKCKLFNNASDSFQAAWKTFLSND